MHIYTHLKPESKGKTGLGIEADGMVELDGIVASATDPVAMINRKLLGIGEGVDGWVVEKIEPKQVTLHGGSETIVLRLR